MSDADKVKLWKKIQKLMDQTTRKLIQEFSPMWTNKQIWEFEQINGEGLTFDMVYAKPNNFESWKSKMAHPDSDVRDTIVRTFDDLLDGHELWIADKGQGKTSKKYVTYLMSMIADVVVESEVCLNFKIKDECLILRIDADADLIDCKEFFEEFYHLATGFNYDINIGIPEDSTEAEMYLTRLQEEFDEKMKAKLGEKYMPGNNDPDTANAK